jgi:hypothetical protein
MKTKNYLFFGTFLLVILAGCTGSDTEGSSAPVKSDYEFYDVALQTPVFVSYYTSIKLTPQQEKIKEEALTSMPAPCCTDYAMATCCCPCNFAKATWGLSNYLIVEKGYNTEQLTDAVNRWIAFAYPNGYAGDACYDGRCGVSFEHDGCGGMTSQLIL